MSSDDPNDIRHVKPLGDKGKDARIKELESDNEKYKAFGDGNFNNVKAQLEKAERVINRIGGMAGNPIARDGCHLICKAVREYQAEKERG
jgi:hypothetical protein